MATSIRNRDKLKMQGLTKREQQVVSVLLQGHSNKEIAHRLGITEGTVKLHLHRILQKTGVIRRVALIASHGRPPMTRHDCLQGIGDLARSRCGGIETSAPGLPLVALAQLVAQLLR
jgi:DNA-binding CsgD family transcriptional regulator